VSVAYVMLGMTGEYLSCLIEFLANRTNGHTIVTVFRLSVCPSVCTKCIVAKRCVLEQKLQLTAYRKSDMIGTKMNDLDLSLEVVARSCQLLHCIQR